MSNYLFVYGIFQERYSHLYRLLNDYKCLGRATAPGFVILNNSRQAAMVPGLLSAGDQTAAAKGDVFDVPDIEKVLRPLDRIESNQLAYVRVKIDVILDGGQQVEAYAYIWMHLYSDDEVLINGNWESA